MRGRDRTGNGTSKSILRRLEGVCPRSGLSTDKKLWAPASPNFSPYLRHRDVVHDRCPGSKPSALLGLSRHPVCLCRLAGSPNQSSCPRPPIEANALRLKFSSLDPRGLSYRDSSLVVSPAILVPGKCPFLWES